MQGFLNWFSRLFFSTFLRIVDCHMSYDQWLGWQGHAPYEVSFMWYSLVMDSLGVPQFCG